MIVHWLVDLKKKTAATSISTVLSCHLTSVFNWISANKLEVNINKYEFISFSDRKSLILLLLKIKSSCIYQTDSLKFLGIIIDKKP